MSSKSVLQKCQVSVSYHKSVERERPTTSDKQECPTRESSKRVLQECEVRVTCKSVK